MKQLKKSSAKNPSLEFLLKAVTCTEILCSITSENRFIAANYKDNLVKQLRLADFICTRDVFISIIQSPFCLLFCIHILVSRIYRYNIIIVIIQIFMDSYALGKLILLKYFLSEYYTKHVFFSPPHIFPIPSGMMGMLKKI